MEIKKEINFEAPELIKLKNKVYAGIVISYSFSFNQLTTNSEEEHIEQLGIIFKTKNKIIYYHDLLSTSLIKYPETKDGRILGAKDYLRSCLDIIQDALISSESLKYFIVKYCYDGEYESLGNNRSMSDFETPYWKKLERMFEEYKQSLGN